MNIQRDYWPTEDWRESALQDQGMDPTFVPKLDEYIKETRPYLNSLLIVRHGYLVFERYYKDYTQQSYQISNCSTSYSG